MDPHSSQAPLEVDFRVRTDSGNLLYDAPCGAIPDPSLLADALKSVTGVVDHGLFLDMADEAILGTDTGVERLAP